MVSKRYGDPFLGPDGKVLELEGLVLHGNLQTDLTSLRQPDKKPSELRHLA